MEALTDLMTKLSDFRRGIINEAVLEVVNLCFYTSTAE